MTKKRFKLFVGKNYGVQKADGEVIFDSIVSIGDADVLVDWLNAIYNENEQLKSRIEYLERKIERERNSYQKQHEKWEKELKSE